MNFPKNTPPKKPASALLLILMLLTMGSELAGQPVALDTFNSGSTTGAILPGTSWAAAGAVVQNPGSLTIAAGNDNGWGATGLNVNGSAMTYVRVTAQRDAGNAAASFVLQFEDPNINTATITVNTAAFATGAMSHVLIPLTLGGGFDATGISGWNLGGGAPPPGQTNVPFRMTLDHLALTSALSLAGGGTFTTVGNQVYAGAQTLTATTVVNTFGASGNAITFNSTIDGAHALTLNTPGATTLTGAVGEATPLASLTTDAGGTTAIDGGKVISTGAQTYNDTVSLGGDTLVRSIGGFVDFLSSLTGNDHHLMIEVDQASSFNRANALASLTKAGNGTLTLTGQSTYTGRTIISAGTLALGVSNALANTSPLTLAGGTFALGGFSQTLGSLTLSSNSTIDFGSGLGLLAFANSSALSDSWSGTLSILNYTTGQDALRFGTSNTGLTLAQLSQISFAGFGAAQIDADGFVTASAIPEPSTYAALAGLGALALAVWRRRSA